jgi:hypothetical protein
MRPRGSEGDSDNKNQEIKGKATGNLKDGPLTGTAAWFKGRHFETTSGNDAATGDLELKRKL